MGLTKFVLKCAVPVPKIETFERFLFIGPHPDDIEIGAGATVAKLAAAGKKICFLICIDGRFGDGKVQGIKGQRLIEMRKEEAIRSAALLGVKDVRFLGFCDGGFYKTKDLLHQMAAVIGDFQPDVIFAPDPHVTSECHIDHIRVGNAASQLAFVAPYPGIMEKHESKAAPVKAIAYYMTAKPNYFVKTFGFLRMQLATIAASYPSQFPEGDAEWKSIELYLKLRAIDFGLRSFKGCAEGFRVLGPTHMHCLPEAGN